ncbi:homing endonuclease HNH [Shewanella sp. phage 1/40]|uniref:HNH endonuclease n=1 Tax=Shewanella sp. phage 1/40 TaxID=1458860 RepID=UPI0004F842F5|nr:HNH endonuclease [Shewanella sp. phage 1/40]AHK11501.1 homing endonuclease HNH [Shewanella sp. phage 1/40]
MKKIKGYSRYSIDECGVIKNIKRDYILQPRNSGYGAYLTVALINDSGVRKTKFVHRLVAENFLAKENGRFIVNHKDGNKYNNHINNLEWCTVAENVQHAYDTGLHIKASGVDSPNTKLSSQKVHNICASLMGGLQITSVAEIHNVSVSIVRNIKKGSCFKEITSAYALDSVKRYSRLSKETVVWVCEMLVVGYTPKDILSKTSNRHITLPRIFGIRAKRSFKEITNSYNFN